MEGQILALKQDVVDRDKEIQNLKLERQILEKEKANMRESWQKEQAEWRELWDRSRDVFDRQRKQMP